MADRVSLVSPSQAPAIRLVAEVGSTNAELLARLAAGEGIEEGPWLVADRQRAGRGRAGRAWFDGVGNFMGSTLVLLRGGDPPAQTLALVAGLAAAEAVAAELPQSSPVRPALVEGPSLSFPPQEESGPSTSSGPTNSPPNLMLKWPNDLLLDGAKLGGILLERRGEAVVVGIGINLAAAPELSERRTTSLAAQGVEVPRNRFAARLAGCWSRALIRWHGGEWPALRAAWLARAHAPGTMLSVQGIGTGAFAGLGEDGAAHLRLADGSTRVIHAGEIEMVGHAARG